MIAKIIGWFVVGVILIGILTGAGFALRAVFFPAHVVRQELNTAYDAIEKTINADNAIYNYEWFKQKKEDIDAGKNKLVNARTTYDSFKMSLPTDRIKWGFEDKTEDGRLRTVVLGLENHLEQMIADYNARSRMATRNIFEDHVLPDFIDALTFIRQ